PVSTNGKATINPTRPARSAPQNFWYAWSTPNTIALTMAAGHIDTSFVVSAGIRNERKVNSSHTPADTHNTANIHASRVVRGSSARIIALSSMPPAWPAITITIAIAVVATVQMTKDVAGNMCSPSNTRAKPLRYAITPANS